jgi:putative protease
VAEEESGTFIFNSRDLCLLEHLPALINSGVAALKIEGRMKGLNYVASVLRVYRRALDEYLADPAGWRCRPEWLEELSKLSHRGYTTGFLFGEPRNVGQEYHSAYIRSHEFVGLVEEAGPGDRIVVGVRNRIRTGDELEFVGPNMRSARLVIAEVTILTPEGDLVEADAANPNQRIVLNPPFAVEPFDLIRREKRDAS